MSDRYQSLIHTPVGQLLAKNLGLPNPTRLERWTEGAPLVTGSVGVGGDGRLGKALVTTLDELGIASVQNPPADQRYKGLVFDATGIASSDRLADLQEFFTPLLRSLEACPRIVVLGTPPESTNSAGERVAQRALEGFTRSLGKEVGRGGTVQLVYVAPAADGALASTLAFLLSPKSAYVSGQVVRVGVHGATAVAEDVQDWARPLAGKVAVVTGASRGIGEQIARVLHRDGAKILGIDVPQAASELQAVTRELDGDHLTLDITTKDAPQRIARFVKDTYGGVDVVVHNAGITRDKLLVNMDPSRWGPVIEVNIAAQLRINEALLASGHFRSAPRIVSVASTSGIAGNRGQTNYAASKGGVMGMVRATAPLLGQYGGSINAVAPGFIETEMTARIPFATREIARRLNSLQQGGQPADVAEAISFLAGDAAGGISGEVLRVCGQNLVGA
jgi:3-oxoacyl-[acyl-carrier protein] reductase